MVGDVQVGQQAIVIATYPNTDTGIELEVGHRFLVRHPEAAHPVRKEQRKVRRHVVAMAFAEAFEHLGCPEQRVGVQLQRVLEELGAHAVHKFSVLRTDLMLVEVLGGGQRGATIQKARHTLRAVAHPEGEERPVAVAPFPDDRGVDDL